MAGTEAQSTSHTNQFINRWTFDQKMRIWTEVVFALGGDHRYRNRDRSRNRSRYRLLQTHTTDCDCDGDCDCDPDSDPDGYSVLLSF